MSTELGRLVEALKVSAVDERHFSADASLNLGRIYGGHTISNAIDAARQCCPQEFAIQSLHGQFLRVGNRKLPIDIEVQDLKDGRRFKLYNVYCRQEGKTIFFATVTFHLPETGFEHTLAAPELVLPDESKAGYYPHRQYYYNQEELESHTGALEARMQQRNDNRKVLDPECQTWVRTVGDNTLSDWEHTLVMAYVSDWNLPSVAMRQHVVPEGERENIASLDHAIWFYRQANMSNWIAFVQDSPAALNSRGHGRGLIYSHAGELLGCVNQEAFLSTSP